MKGCDKLHYVIKNRRGMYLRLDDHGTPMTCGVSKRDVFDYKKACNLVDHLPKNLKNMGFRVECENDIDKIHNTHKTMNVHYEPPDSITRWIDKFGQCGDVIEEAKKRKEELVTGLSNADKKLSDIAHTIENTNCDMYSAWLQRKQQQELYKKRRNIKNELLIINGVLTGSVTYLNRSNVKKAVDGLSNKKYTYKIDD